MMMMMVILMMKTTTMAATTSNDLCPAPSLQPRPRATQSRAHPLAAPHSTHSRSPAASLFDETASGSSASSRSPSLRRRPRGQIGSGGGGGADLVRRRKKKPLHTSIEHLYDGLPAHSRPKLVAADRAYVRPDFVRPDTMSTAYSSPSASAMGVGPGRPQPKKKKKQPFNASPAHDGTLVQAAGHSLPRLGGGNAWKAKRSLRAAAVAKAHMGAELRATPLGFERALREHEQGMRRSAIALADALDASREVERGHATVLEEGGTLCTWRAPTDNDEACAFSAITRPIEVQLLRL